MKRFIETQGGCKPNYDAPARRGNAQVDFSWSKKNTGINKENLKKVTSATNLHKGPLDFFKSCSEILADAQKTPSGRSNGNTNSGLKASLK